jgi:hypothetical protein
LDIVSEVSVGVGMGVGQVTSVFVELKSVSESENIVSLAAVVLPIVGLLGFSFLTIANIRAASHPSLATLRARDEVKMKWKESIDQYLC